MVEYLSVDLDWPTLLEVVRAWEYVEKNGKGYTNGRVSASGTGVHIRDRHHLPPEVPVNGHHRRMAGDDPDRIEADRDNQLEHNQVLWDRKNGREAGPWVTDCSELIRKYRASVPLLPEVKAWENRGR